MKMHPHDSNPFVKQMFFIFNVNGGGRRGLLFVIDPK